MIRRKMGHIQLNMSHLFRFCLRSYTPPGEPPSPPGSVGSVGSVVPGSSGSVGSPPSSPSIGVTAPRPRRERVSRYCAMRALNWSVTNFTSARASASGASYR